MRELSGKVVAITGAGSGIGRALAVALAGAGCRLALLERDPQGLAGAVELLRAAPGGGPGVHGVVLDVADADAVEAAAAAVVELYGQVDAVVNNAGIGLDAADTTRLRLADFRRVMDVNFWGVVHGTRAFLPHLLARPEAAVVNVSSIYGISAVGLQTPYCASKFAVRGFTESLRMELRVTAPHVLVTTVHPGGVRTAIARHSLAAGVRSAAERQRDIDAFERQLRSTPEQAAAAIVRGLRRGRQRVLIGGDARALDAVARLLPVRYTGVVLRQLERAGLVEAADRSPARRPGEETRDGGNDAAGKGEPVPRRQAGGQHTAHRAGEAHGAHGSAGSGGAPARRSGSGGRR